MGSAWPSAELRQVIQLDLDKVQIDPAATYNMVGVLSFGKGLFHREPVSGNNTSYKYFYRLQKDHIVMSQLFGWEGALALSSSEFAGEFLSPQFPTFVCNQEVLDRRYLGWFIRRPVFWEELGKRAKGMGDRRRTLNPESLLSCYVPLPPISEQRRIVTKIDELSSKIEEAHRLCHEATREVHALLASAREVAFKSKPYWSEARVGDFCEMPQYGYTESATGEPVGPRFLRITDIQNGRVNWDNVPYCSCPNPQPYFLKENDILFARTGATTGKSFLIRDCPEAVFASYLIRLRVRSTVTPEYLYQYFQSPSYWIQVIEEKKGTGQPNVNGKKLANIRVPISPPGEQRRIVEYLDGLQTQVDALNLLQAEIAAELDALLPSILDRAFKGEL